MFGMTLFPFHADTVDHVAMDAFFSWDVHLNSPLPAILADTLLSIKFCHQKQGKTLRCCTTLLTQTIPCKEELGRLCLFYDPDHRDEMHAICRAWEKRIYIGDGELGCLFLMTMRNGGKEEECLSLLLHMHPLQQIESYKKKSMP
ncbi:hypothetical protein Fmac_026566 [Flemingia macrophylla]|uniref:DUF7745 domain-containing protein n=1 Tax=Flemingia macrophylla TaxID=520843 RepID=A0ABD1LFE4_9FABA